MIRRLAFVLPVGVLAGSGGYALIYLFRWEWHRAIITALFFVAAEVALAAAMVLRRLGRLEQQLTDLAERPARPVDLDPAVLARIQGAAPPPANRFEWLDPSSPNLSVFLPFLLGVGALASGLAWVVEQTARRTTTPTLERRLAHRLTPLALPAGGLLGPEPAPTAQPERRPVRGWVGPLLVVVVVAAMATAAIDWLGDAIQTRPDARQADVATRIDLELRGGRSSAWPDEAAAALWGTCSHVLHGTVGQASFRNAGQGRFEILVPTHIGHHAEQRVRGCLEDAVVDRIQASVRGVEVVPAG